MSLLSGDRRLLEGFRRGDTDALTRVYNEYAPALAAFLARGFTFSSKGRLLQFRGYHQPFDLENALQETFARAFSERARMAYDGLSPYKSYLTAIARNLVLSELRRREIAMSQLVQVRDDGQEVAPSVANVDASSPDLMAAEQPQPSAEHEFMRQELLKLYQAFVDELDAQEQGFFNARFEQRQTQVDAGAAVGLSHMQARTLEKKLRKRFLKFMHGHGYLDAYAGPHKHVGAER
ncbi:MAG: sigma-70 family RNA polymerase sigma factor [Myxococcales bacterium]|nr:sigma-70 family RNA polymerase sigma factor [Myxococcales bacterium]